MVTMSLAREDLMGGMPVFVLVTWHWYTPSSPSKTGEIDRDQSAVDSLTKNLTSYLVTLLEISWPTTDSLGKPGSDLLCPRPNPSLVHCRVPPLCCTWQGRIT